MSNALVVRGTKAVTAQAQTRAAQYVRMSTDYQRYSIENQAAVIATYAQVHGLKIVRTYSDEGRSGLRLKNRVGLIQLLEDVQSGQTENMFGGSSHLARCLRHAGNVLRARVRHRGNEYRLKL
jgi:hypothetical protein